MPQDLQRVVDALRVGGLVLAVSSVVIVFGIQLLFGVLGILASYHGPPGHIEFDLLRYAWPFLVYGLPAHAAGLALNARRTWGPWAAIATAAFGVLWPLWFALFEFGEVAVIFLPFSGFCVWWNIYVLRVLFRPTSQSFFAAGA